MPHDYSINERIKALRISNGFTQEKMAELLGLKGSSYSQMERKGIITVATAKRLAKNFRCQHCYSDTEIKILRIVFSLNKKQRSAVYKYANQIFQKEISIS